MVNPGPWGPPPKRRTPSRIGKFLWLGALAALGVFVWGLSSYFPGAVSTSLDQVYLVRLIAIAVLMSSGLLFIKDWNLKQTAKNTLMWLGVAGCLMLGFTYQTEIFSLFNRLRSDLIPGYPVETSPGEAVLSQGEGGNYFVYGTVNGTRVLFVIDTGASSIVLSPSDAKRIGIPVESLKFDRAYETANGTGRGANYKVANLSVGKLSFSDVPVSINQANMSASLLGMTFLNRLKSFEFSGKKLILRW